MKGFWSRLAVSHPEGAADYWDYFGHQLTALADIPPNVRILDLGCGGGSSFIPVALKLGDKGCGIAADIDWESLRECKHSLLQHPVRNSACIQMDAGYLGFRSDCVDFVLSGFMGWDYCFDFANNRFTHPEIRMEEIHRVVRPGGLVLFSSWALQEDIEWLANIFRIHLPQLAPEITKRYHPNFLKYSKETPQGLKIMLNSAGFIDIQCYTERAYFSSPDEEQMRRVGWGWYFRD